NRRESELHVSGGSSCPNSPATSAAAPAVLVHQPRQRPLRPSQFTSHVSGRSRRLSSPATSAAPPAVPVPQPRQRPLRPSQFTKHVSGRPSFPSSPNMSVAAPAFPVRDFRDRLTRGPAELAERVAQRDERRRFHVGGDAEE